MYIIIAVIIIHVYSYHCDYGEVHDRTSDWKPVVELF